MSLAERDDILDLLQIHCKAFNLPIPVKEYRFHATRRWRVDYAFSDYRLGVEVEGGIFGAGGGRHNRGAGYRKDLEKYNELSIMGWRLLRFLPEQVKSGIAIDSIKRYFDARREE